MAAALWARRRAQRIHYQVIGGRVGGEQSSASTIVTGAQVVRLVRFCFVAVAVIKLKLRAGATTMPARRRCKVSFLAPMCRNRNQNVESKATGAPRQANNDMGLSFA